MAEKPKVPAVAEDMSSDRDNVLVTGIKNGQLQILQREVGGRHLILAESSTDWWGKHFFPTKEKPAVFAEVLRAYALECGAQVEAAEELGRFVTITKEEFNKMTTTAAGGKPAAGKAKAEKPAAEAKTKKPAAAPKEPAITKAPAKKPETKAEAAKAPTKKPAAEKAAPKTEKPAAKSAEQRAADNKERLNKLNEKKKAEKAAAGPKPARVSVSGRMRELIIAGKMKDEEIFAVVKKEFNLTDDKKSYVAWNRAKLKKEGKIK